MRTPPLIAINGLNAAFVMQSDLNPLEIEGLVESAIRCLMGHKKD